MRCINPFKCDIVENIIKESNICPQVITTKDKNEYCCGFNYISKFYNKCSNCKHYYFTNTKEGKRVIENANRRLSK